MIKYVTPNKTAANQLSRQAACLGRANYLGVANIMVNRNEIDMGQIKVFRWTDLSFDHLIRQRKGLDVFTVT